ncbi:ATP-dependent helicase [Candidatus Omnitrophota bacterium]
MPVDFKKLLNPAQFAAVSAKQGSVLVIAGAGSGKTRVIEYRVLSLVQSGINPKSILLLTFTRRAARQMLERAARHDARCQDVEGGTFHSFCYMLLKKYASVLGFPNRFLVLDEADAEESIQRCSTELGFFEKEQRFPRKDTLRAVLSMAVNKNISVAEVLEREYPHFIEYTESIDKLRKRYAEYKISKNYLDYDDLLVYCVLLLEQEQVRSRIHQKYRYIMVDEYQDTNALQGRITYLLGREHGNVMAVGDDAQSIYGFRGATHENIMRFPDSFSGCRVIKLEENYRSTQSILDLSNSVLQNMKNKYSKCLTSARQQPGDQPELLFFKDTYQEARWIAARIKQLRDQGLALSHQAVLFRSAYISIPLQAELSKRNIPYQVFGGLKFYETAHVRDVLAHLRVLVNPKDELGWMRVLLLIRGVGPKTAGGILAKVMACSSLQQIVKQVFEKELKNQRHQKALLRLARLLKQAEHRRSDVGAKFADVLEYYRPILKDKFDDWHLRLNDLETLSQISARYKSAETLLADFAIESPERSVGRVEARVHDPERPLSLSTIHSAKGLEWQAVFLLGVTDGILPVSFALNDEDAEEEEHRLLYVAVTRARDQLFLSMHHQGTRGGITQFNKISRFIDLPNICSKLSIHDSAGLGWDGEDYSQVPAEEIDPIYSKESLLDEVIDSFP